MGRGCSWLEARTARSGRALLPGLGSGPETERTSDPETGVLLALYSPSTLEISATEQAGGATRSAIKGIKLVDPKDTRHPLEVLVRDRTDQVPRELQAYASTRLRRLSSHLGLLEKVEIEFDREAKRSREPLEVVEIIVKITARRLLPLRVRETGRDLRSTLDRALKRIDEEILTLKERFR